MTKLSETQSLILTAGAQRPDNLALPLPKGLAGAAGLRGSKGGGTRGLSAAKKSPVCTPGLE